MRQKGFTLIELVVVIVILGILAATALPKFIDLSSDAKEAAFQGVRGGAASAMSVNYAGCAVTNHKVTGGKCQTVTACTDTGKLMQGGLPSGYTATGTLPTTGNGADADCTLVAADYPKPAGPTTFTGIVAGSS